VHIYTTQLRTSLPLPLNNEFPSTDQILSEQLFNLNANGNDYFTAKADSNGTHVFIGLGDTIGRLYMLDIRSLSSAPIDLTSQFNNTGLSGLFHEVQVLSTGHVVFVAYISPTSRYAIWYLPFLLLRGKPIPAYTYHFRVTNGTPEGTKFLGLFPASSSLNDLKIIELGENMVVTFASTQMPTLWRFSRTCVIDTSQCFYPDAPIAPAAPLMNPPIAPPMNPPPAPPVLPPTTGTIIPGNITNAAVLDFTNVTIVTIIGDFEQLSNASLILTADSSLTISGCAVLNGSLRISVSDSVSSTPVDIILYQSSCREGEFSAIEVDDPYADRDCGNRLVTANPTYSSDRLSILFNVQNPTCDGVTTPDNTALIAGSVVGAVLGAAIIVVVLILAIPSWREKVFPFLKRNNTATN